MGVIRGGYVNIAFLFYGNGCSVWPVTLPLSSVVRPRLVDGVLVKPMVKSIRIDGSEVKVFEWALCNVVAYFLHDCIIRMGVMSHWGTFPLPGIIKQSM